MKQGGSNLSWMSEEQQKDYITNLMSQMPFIKFKTLFKGYENRLSEILLSETLLQMLGYSNEYFACSVLKEGLPQ